MNMVTHQAHELQDQSVQVVAMVAFAVPKPNHILMASTN